MLRPMWPRIRLKGQERTRRWLSPGIQAMLPLDAVYPRPREQIRAVHTSICKKAKRLWRVATI